MNATPLILSFNTATPGGTVCLVRDYEVLASIAGDPAISHSSTLLRDIDQVLSNAGISLTAVDLLAAAAGPGSFTGLRIGIASLKALSMTLSRPCYGIPTLHAVAHGAGVAVATVAVLPAGRGEVFAQLLSVSAAGVVSERDAPAHLSPQALIEKYEQLSELKWSGPGARMYQALIREGAVRKGIEFTESTQIRDGWTLVSAEENLAKEIAALALQRYRNGQIENAELLQAIYVRPSDAELKANVSQ